MMVGIGFVVALAVIAFAAFRVMARKQSTAVRDEQPRQPAYDPSRRAHYEARHPEQFALPPVTIETLPIDFKKVAEVVPPIDPNVLAALVASGSRAAVGTPRPEMLARGSLPPGADLDDAETLSPQDDFDAAETATPSSDLDDDAMTRTTLPPVR